MLDGNWVTKLAKPEITHLRKREGGRERKEDRDANELAAVRRRLTDHLWNRKIKTLI